jgi:hypothetical protein
MLVMLPQQELVILVTRDLVVVEEVHLFQEIQVMQEMVEVEVGEILEEILEDLVIMEMRDREMQEQQAM